MIIKEARLVLQMEDGEGLPLESVIAEFDILQVWYCESCEVYFTEEQIDLENPLYECGECGAVFSRSNSENGNHRCECGRFASKLADVACPECEESEAEAREAFVIERANDDPIYAEIDDPDGFAQSLEEVFNG